MSRFLRQRLVKALSSVPTREGPFYMFYARPDPLAYQKTSWLSCLHGGGAGVNDVNEGLVVKL